MGQWEENGVMFTYTQRRDVPAHECFVGAIRTIINDQNEILISEAGENCKRVAEPLRKSMKLVKQASCYLPPVTKYRPPVTTQRPRKPTPTSWYPTRLPPIPTKPWHPITEPPGGNSIDSSSDSPVIPKVLLILCLLWTSRLR